MPLKSVSPKDEKLAFSPLSKLPVKTLLIGIQLSENKLQNDSRKWVCVRFSKKAKKLVAEKYDNDLLDKARNKGKEFYLAYYVRTSEQNSIYEDANTYLSEFNSQKDDETKLDVINKLKGRLHAKSSFYTQHHDDKGDNQGFDEVYRSYDAVTGNCITHQFDRLVNIYHELKEEHESNKEIYGESALEGPSKILTEMESLYSEYVFRHKQLTGTQAHDCFITLDEKFLEMKTSFSEIFIKLKAKTLKDKVEKLLVECGNVCAEGTFTRKIVNENNAISSDMHKLSQQLNNTIEVVESNKVIITETIINPYERAYHELVDRLNNLKAEIAYSMEQAEKNTSELKEATNPQRSLEKAAPLFKQLEELLAKIENHETDKGKTEIKGDLIKEINNVLNQQKSSCAELTHAVEKANSFINANENQVKIYTGFWPNGKSKLGEFIEKLKDLLERLLHIFSGSPAIIDGLTGVSMTPR